MNINNKIDYIISSLMKIINICENHNKKCSNMKSILSRFINNRQIMKSGYSLIPKYLKKDIDLLLSSSTHPRGLQAHPPDNFEFKKWIESLDELQLSLLSYIESEARDVDKKK